VASRGSFPGDKASGA